MVQFDAKLRLPTALELPDPDETPVDNELQDSIPAILKAILALIWQNRQDWFFGIDMGIFAPDLAAIIPDGFLSLGVPRFRPEYGDRGRPSYVLWEEGVVPSFALEVVSKTYRQEYEKKRLDYQNLGVLYYVVYDPEAFQPKHERFEVYCLVDGAYVLMSGDPVWLPEIGLGIGRVIQQIDGWNREWLFWFSEDGERYPVPEEFQRHRAELAEQEAQEAAERTALAQQEAQEADRRAALATRQAEQERQAKKREQQRAEAAEQRAQALAERLKALGVDPDTL